MARCAWMIRGVRVNLMMSSDDTPVKLPFGAYRRHLLVRTGPWCTQQGESAAPFDRLGEKLKQAASTRQRCVSNGRALPALLPVAPVRLGAYNRVALGIVRSLWKISIESFVSIGSRGGWCRNGSFISRVNVSILLRSKFLERFILFPMLTAPKKPRSICYLLCLSGILLLSGCASEPWQTAIPAADPDHSLVLLELPATVEGAALRHLSDPEEGALPDDATLLKMKNDILHRLDAVLRKTLESHGLSGVSIVAVSEGAGQTVGKPVTDATLQSLKSAHPARYYFRASISDFGETPRSWLDSYVLFEVATTGVVTAVLYSNPPTRALAWVYLTSEGVEETAEGYSGFWLVNRLSRPVRIEEDLIDGQDGEVLWQDSETGMADWHWRNLWHMDGGRREELLNDSMNNAAEKLVRVLKDGPRLKLRQ